MPHADEPSRLSLPVLILLGLWALVGLAYPAFLFTGMVRSWSADSFAEAIGHVLLFGLLELPVALIALGLWAAAVGGGMAALRRAGLGGLGAGERAVFGGALGMGILSLGTFLLAKVSGGHGWLLTASTMVLVLAMLVAGVRDLAVLVRACRAWLGDWLGRRRASSLVVVLLGLGIVLFALTRANVPVVGDYDSLEYHLAAPAKWRDAGQVYFLRDNVYTNMPQNVEMLYLLAMSVCGGRMLGATVGLQVGIGFVVLTAAAVALCGRRVASEAAGLAGAALFLTMPMLAELATLNSYVVELPLTAYSFLTLYAFLLLRRARDARVRRRRAALTGVMAGLAVGCKYPALLFVLAPVLAFIVARGVYRLRHFWRSVGEAALAAALALAVAGPWFARNAANTGNPTYPLLYRVFGSSNWTLAQDVKFAKAHGPPHVRIMDLWRPFCSYAFWRTQPGELTERPWRPPMSPVLFLFALVPLALADRRSTVPVLAFAIVFVALGAKQTFWPGHWRVDVVLAAGVLALVTSPAFLLPRGEAVYFALYFVLCLLAWHTLTHRLDRFLDPASPAVAVLAGMGVAAVGGRWPRRVARGVLVAGLGYALATTVLIHAGRTAAGLALSSQEYLRLANKGSSYCQPAMEAINGELPRDATVLFVGESRTFYCRRPARAATVFDRHPIDRILEAALAARPPATPRELDHRLLAAAPPAEQGDPRPARLSADILQLLHDALAERGVTHLYVNWPEVDRLNNSYAYHFDGSERTGYSEHITRQLFADLLSRGHLRRVATFGSGLVPPFALYELSD
ncbi:MAG: hypothetical protein ACOC8D_00885 [bacterium]